MRTVERTIDHRTLRSLVSAGTSVSAEVVGLAGTWGVIVHNGRARQTLAATRGAPRTFRRFETLAIYLKDLSITNLRVHTGEFKASGVHKPVSKRSKLASDRLKRAYEAAAYDKLFRAQVQASIDDPRPNVSDDTARAEFTAKRVALRSRIERAEKAKTTKAAKPRIKDS